MSSRILTHLQATPSHSESIVIQKRSNLIRQTARHMYIYCTSYVSRRWRKQKYADALGLFALGQLQLISVHAYSERYRYNSKCMSTHGDMAGRNDTNSSA